MSETSESIENQTNFENVNDLDLANAMLGLSRELQIGKAGEHFVCCDLILQGYNAFLADQGLPYDIIVDINGIIKRVQVKTTETIKKYNGISQYLFNISRSGRKRLNKRDMDYIALVALDKYKVAYFPVNRHFGAI